jgi:Helix-turn-helix domain
MVENKPELVEVTEAAREIGRSAQLVRRLVDRGDLKALRTASGQRLILRESLDAMMRERSRKTRWLASSDPSIPRGRRR